MRPGRKKTLLKLGATGAALLIPCLLLLRRAPFQAAGQAATQNTASPNAESLQTYRNLGKAYYEQGQYAQAAQEFQQTVSSGRAVATDYVDLGLALMQLNRLDEALGALTTAKQMAPNMVAVDYNLGILYKRELRYPLAEAALKRVIAADPENPAAWFNLGTIYFAERKLDEALAAHERVNNMGFARGQNFYVASLFHTFTILARTGHREEAQKMLQLHETMRNKVPGISLQNPALEGGKYGSIPEPSTPAVEVASRDATEQVTFRDITSKLGISTAGAARSHEATSSNISAAEYSPEFARRNLVPLLGPSVAIGDYDGDGRPDLYVVNPGGKNRLLRNSANGTFQNVTAKVDVAGPGESLSATFADYDNSGHPSLFVVGLGGVKLYKNNDGTFADVTEKAGLKPHPNELDTRALLFDADNDGLLDLVVTAYTDISSPPHKDMFRFPDDFEGGVVHFYHNNGDGTFSDTTASSGLGEIRGRFRDVLFADFNGDGYSDLVFFRDDGPPLLFLNTGEDKFVDGTHDAGTALSSDVAIDGAIADFDHDGSFDLALWTKSGYEVLRNDGNARFTAFPDLPAIKPSAGLLAFRGVVADFNGDSFADLLVADSSGTLHLLGGQGGRFHDEALQLPSGAPEVLASLRATWLEAPGGLDLVGVTRSGQLKVWSKTGPPAHWLEVKMDGSKSNKEGVGAIVELKKGDFYDKILVSGGPVRVYTGDLSSLDVVRVTWPNAIVQNHVNVATDESVTIRESERLASSCPFLYAWNGKRFVFVTDVLGIAPLGELASDGTRIKPDFHEFVRLPANLPQRNGTYQFQLTDEMREVDYFDHLRLMAVDHPAGESVYANEIYFSSPDQPALYVVRKEQTPVSATDDRGRNVLPLLSQADGRYVTGFQQNRILGMAELHSLTLDLGKLEGARRIALWLTGWVFWTDSNGSRAMMSNPSLQMISPYLQVRNSRGRWVTVIPDMGLPSGTNRTIRVDLTGKFLSSDHHVRIMTNLCVYWDRIFFTTHDRLIKATVEISPEAADLHYRGFSSPSTDRHHLRPDYFEYSSLMKQAPWDPMQGRYTRYGDVRELLGGTDDQLVVMSTGDEMTIKFNARALPAPKPGWKRSFFLDAVGYAKDGEPNTAGWKTVAPLPFRAMSNYPPACEEHPPADSTYQAYLRQYQTRLGYRLIPPLAPPDR